MTVSLNRAGGLEPPETTALSTADPTTIHTASSQYVRVVETIVLASVDTTNACEITLRWVNASAVATVFWQGDIPAGTTVVIDNIPILTSGNGTVRSLTAEAETGGDVNVTVISSAQSKHAG